MDKKTFKHISSFSFFIPIALLLFQSTLSAPVKTTVSFLKNITEENCAFPNGIVLPFKDSAATLDLFSERLKICNAPDAETRSLEAIRLCNEIYDAIRNITCHSDKNVQLPEIKIEFSDSVCDDISSLQLKHALAKKGLLLHLTDKFVCEMMCEGDFLPACQVLLWSFQIQKRIEGVPQVQSIQNTLEQGNAEGDNGVAPSNTKTEVTPDHENTLLEKKQQLLQPDQQVPAVEIPDYNKKTDEAQQIANDDTGENELDQSVNVGKDVQENKENEIPEEPIMEEKENKQVIEKQDQTLKPEEQNKLSVIVNEAVNDAKEKTIETKVTEPTPIIKKLPDNENKINVDEGPTKNSVPAESEKTVFKNKPAELVPEQTKDISNKTKPAKSVIDVNNNLPAEVGKEIPVNVKPKETTDAAKSIKPVVSEQNEESSKFQEKVLSPSTPSKVLPGGTNEAKVSIKPESTLSKGSEIGNSKVIPTIGKEDTVSATTVADLEAIEGNGIPNFPEKESDLYNDSESDGEYPKLDYGDDIIDSSKNKKPEESDSGKIYKPAQVDNESPPNVFPQNPYSGRVDPQSFLDQEEQDSHFFFYFLSLVMILMGGYLLFHNKQKIIALIVEGRHERRRRSHGAAYKKLETK